MAKIVKVIEVLSESPNSFGGCVKDRRGRSEQNAAQRSLCLHQEFTVDKINAKVTFDLENERGK